MLLYTVDEERCV